MRRVVCKLLKIAAGYDQRTYRRMKRDYTYRPEIRHDFQTKVFPKLREEIKRAKNHPAAAN